MKNTIIILSLLLIINSVDCDYEKKKTYNVILDKLESYVINDKETSGISIKEIVQANNEFDSIEPRSLIRLKRKEPLLNCVSRLIVMALTIDDAQVAIDKMESNYKLLRTKCKTGLIDYFFAHGARTQLFIRSLLWEENGAKQIDDKLISDAKLEYNYFLMKYYRLDSSKENIDEIDWLIQYFNSHQVRILSKYIYPILIFDNYNNSKLFNDNQSSNVLRDIFTDQMRFNGYIVINGEYSYRNYDIDHI